MLLESNPMIIRQHDARVLGPFQVLDEDGTPVSLSTDRDLRWRAYDRPGGTLLFSVGSITASGNGGSLILSTGKESGHFFHSMTSQAIGSALPGPYPTEFHVSIGTSGGRRTFEGPMLLVQERLQ